MLNYKLASVGVCNYQHYSARPGALSSADGPFQLSGKVSGQTATVTLFILYVGRFSNIISKAYVRYGVSPGNLRRMNHNYDHE